MYCYYYDEFIKKFQLDPNSIEPLYDFVRRTHPKITPHIQFHLNEMQAKNKLNLKIIYSKQEYYVLKNRSKNETVIETWAHLVAQNIFSMTPAKHCLLKDKYGKVNILSEYIPITHHNFNRRFYTQNKSSKMNMLFQFICCPAILNCTDTIGQINSNGEIIFRNIDLAAFGYSPLIK